MKSSLLFLFSVLTTFTSSAQWQKQLSGTSENLNDVAVLNQSSAVVVGNNGAILKTTDKGLNWVSKNSGTTNNLNAASFRNEENGIAVGNEVISRTSDGGESWSSSTYVDNFTSVSYREPYFGEPNILIGSDNGKILFSGNDGSSWGDTILLSNEPMIAVGFNYCTPNLHSPEALAATTFHTGTTFSPLNHWNLYDNPVNPVWDILTGGDFYDWSQYLIGWYGNPGPIPLLLRRVDSDISWEAIYSFIPAPNIPEDITSVDEKIFVCCWQGKILFTSNGGVTSIEENQEITEYNLNQNYPNPFNPATVISYQLAVSNHIILTVYDILGKEIVTLINEFKPAGFYTIDFKGSNLPSGTYFYKLQAGNYIETRKMVLTK